MAEHKTAITPDLTLGELAGIAPQLIPWFYEQKLDFCCGGNRKLKTICQEKKISFQQFLDRLETPLQAAEAEPVPALSDRRLPQFIDHIVKRFHQGHRRDFESLSPLMVKVSEAHGARAPHLLELRRVWNGIIADIEPHMHKEEQILFPLFLRSGSLESIPAAPCGSINPLFPMAVMRREHEALGRLLGELAELTDDFQPPSWACHSLTLLFQGLGRFHREALLHIHLENNLLFPMVEARFEAGKKQDNPIGKSRL